MKTQLAIISVLLDQNKKLEKIQNFLIKQANEYDDWVSFLKLSFHQLLNRTDLSLEHKTVLNHQRLKCVRGFLKSKKPAYYFRKHKTELTPVIDLLMVQL